MKKEYPKKLFKLFEMLAFSAHLVLLIKQDFQIMKAIYSFTYLRVQRTLFILIRDAYGTSRTAASCSIVAPAFGIVAPAIDLKPNTWINNQAVRDVRFFNTSRTIDKAGFSNHEGHL